METSKNEVYTVDFFINKFEAISEEMWNIGDYHNISLKKFCALGHCGFYLGHQTDEGLALDRLFTKHLNLSVAKTNDGKYQCYLQTSPKQRILAALFDIKAKQQPEVKPEPVKERIVYVSVDQAVRKLQKEIAEN